MGSMSRPAPAGLADQPLEEQRDRVVAAWDAFRAVAGAVDLDRPSRLPGWTNHDVVVHVGDWPGVPTMDALIAGARESRADAGPTGDGRADAGQPAGAGRPRPDTDAANAAVVAAHRDAGRDEVLAALDRSRRRVAGWFDAPDAPDGPRALGSAPTPSVVGVLPLLTVVSASAYELAVHALDLRGPRPGDPLLDAGLAALVDVTGFFAARRGLAARLTAWTGAAGWRVTVDGGGWVTERVTERVGAAVEGDAAVLLDASAGRRAVPGLLATRALTVHGLPELMALSAIVQDVPGLPGGPALTAAGRWVGGVGRLLRLGR
jgi:hypothetical protein